MEAAVAVIVGSRKFAEEVKEVLRAMIGMMLDEVLAAFIAPVTFPSAVEVLPRTTLEKATLDALDGWMVKEAGDCIGDADFFALKELVGGILSALSQLLFVLIGRILDVEVMTEVLAVLT